MILKSSAWPPKWAHRSHIEIILTSMCHADQRWNISGNPCRNSHSIIQIAKNTIKYINWATQFSHKNFNTFCILNNLRTLIISIHHFPYWPNASLLCSLYSHSSKMLPVLLHILLYCPNLWLSTCVYLLMELILMVKESRLYKSGGMWCRTENILDAKLGIKSATEICSHRRVV